MIAMDRPALLWLLILVPVLLAGLRLGFRHSMDGIRIARIVGISAQALRRCEARRRILLVAAVVAAIGGSVGIRQSTPVRAPTRPGQEVVVVLDVSRSMLATDVMPTRLSEAVKQLRDALNMVVDERIGVVLFAESAMLACPLTVDADAIDAALRSAMPPPLRGGSSLAAGLMRALQALPESSGRAQAIILVSDGETTGDDAARTLDAALDLARERRVSVHTVGVGTPEGAGVPVESNGAAGVESLPMPPPVARTRLMDSTLRLVAQGAAGTYRPLVPGQPTVRTLHDELRRANRPNDPDTGRAALLDRALFAASFACLGLECLLSLTSRGLARRPR
jgi:Ca-activated chloride channel family protein